LSNDLNIKSNYKKNCIEMLTGLDSINPKT
jgi:hypothetical protein